MPFWVFPCASWNPYFCIVWWLWMSTKKDHFPKQIVATKIRVFYLPNTIVFACFFLKNAILSKWPFLFTTTQKTLFFVFFEIILFHVFHFFFFSCSNIRQKKCTFSFENPFVWHPGKLPKNYFCTRTNLGPSFDSKKTQILDQVLTLQHMHICCSC